MVGKKKGSFVKGGKKETVFKPAKDSSSVSRQNSKASNSGSKGKPHYQKPQTSCYTSIKIMGGMCMIGNIYTAQKCPMCGGALVHDEKRKGLFCRKHVEIAATGMFRVRFGRDICKGARGYAEAARILNGLRWETDQGTFDLRDHQRGNPLGFEVLARQWLIVKKKSVKKKAFNNLNNFMERAIEAWGGTNIKLIDYATIEDFLYAQKVLDKTRNVSGKGRDVSDKTRANIRSCLNSFFTWLKHRRILSSDQMPEVPEVSFELGWRNTIPKEMQKAMLEEIYRISWEINPRIWIGIMWLAVYYSIRPGELITLKERNLHLEDGRGHIIIPDPKEKKPKVVPMLPEDVEIVRSLPRGLPDMPFFRHAAGISGVREGAPFGDKYLYKWWKKACANLGVEGVDLYGGTRHSTVMALRHRATPEQIKGGSMHSTNEAFERYFGRQDSDALNMYQLSWEDLKKDSGSGEKGRVIRATFRGKKGKS
ncbi:MAG: site-specific integrase [Pseudomonadota bacterium]